MTTTPEPQRLDGHILPTTLRDLQARIMATCEALGWYEDDRSRGEDRALIHSEIAEALEAYRDHGHVDMTEALCGRHEKANGTRHLCKPEGTGAELADVLIRLLDTVGRWHVEGYWLDMTLADVVPYRVPSGRFGDWLDVMHTATATGNHELLLRTLVGAAEFQAHVDLENETLRKMGYNATREHRHGGKRL